MSKLGLYLKRYQNRCILCQSRPIALGLMCDECDRQLLWCVPFHIDVANGCIDGYAAGHYDGLMAQALSQFKDQENLQALPFLLHALNKLAEWGDLSQAVILPVPTTDDRLTKRGFYPVGQLANYLSQLTDCPIYGGLIRHRDGRHQRGLSRAERLDNVDEVFAVLAPPPAGKIIVFDDVVTTGATLKAVIKTLYDFDGELQISACCLAHGTPRR